MQNLNSNIKEKETDEEGLNLLALPRPVLLKCLKAMSPVQLIHLSFLSSRVKELAKFVTWPFGMAMYLDFHRRIKIYYIYESLNIFEKFGTMDENHDESLKECMDHLSEMLPIDLDEVVFRAKNFESNWEWLEARQWPALYISVEDESVNEEDAEMIITTVLKKGAQKRPTVQFGITTPEGFRYPGEFKFNHPPNKLIIGKSTWFTMKHLMEGACVVNRLSASLISNEELNLFLRTWMEGTNENLNRIKCLSIQRSRSVEGSKEVEESIMGGLDYVRVEEIRMHEITFEDGERVHKSQLFEDSMDIRRHDGTVATISVNGHYLPDCLIIEFCVW